MGANSSVRVCGVRLLGDMLTWRERGEERENMRELNRKLRSCSMYVYSTHI